MNELLHWDGATLSVNVWVVAVLFFLAALAIGIGRWHS